MCVIIHTNSEFARPDRYPKSKPTIGHWGSLPKFQSNRRRITQFSSQRLDKPQPAIELTFSGFLLMTEIANAAFHINYSPSINLSTRILPLHSAFQIHPVITPDRHFPVMEFGIIEALWVMVGVMKLEPGVSKLLHYLILTYTLLILAQDLTLKISTHLLLTPLSPVAYCPIVRPYWSPRHDRHIIVISTFNAEVNCFGPGICHTKLDYANREFIHPWSQWINKIRDISLTNKGLIGNLLKRQNFESESLHEKYWYKCVLLQNHPRRGFMCRQVLSTHPTEIGPHKESRSGETLYVPPSK
jgi:hypothetical protein